MIQSTQTCTTCAHLSKCWSLNTNKGKPISTQNVTINILICRLQLGINRNQAAANILKIFRPGMIKLISHVKQSGGAMHMDMDQLLLDMQSTAIEYLMRDYKIGDRGRATPYLFDPHQGFLTKWVKWVTSKNRRFYSNHELYAPNSESEDGEGYDPEGGSQGTSTGWSAVFETTDSVRYSPYVELERQTSDLSQIVSNIIDDGQTLNSNEYRVIKFCLANSNEANNTRHIDGLHIYLAKLMGVSRPRITRLYKRAKDKIKKRYAGLEVEGKI